MTENPDFFDLIRQYAPNIINKVPYANTLGFELVDLEPGKAIARAPYKPETIGDIETGIIHGGVVTALLDNVSGVSVIAALSEMKSTATLDLRIDYMRPAEVGRDIIAEAECYHMTRTVAFTRAWAYHESRDRVIATASGSFALNTIKGFPANTGEGS
ncbi:PaaI family thioesterase [Ponticaulis sp.]|uniref:PaaI family thioesterase n=1 Tax=Ponticaulis sp. TaxID=2020902 RepID=UPI000C50AEB7|nr:PaaI family thioesterase [Ponticaulis sp.]MAF56516.1 thioesterase [Ponticaulis sp.]MBN05693.1 thioesterase [Ponticaulis sp.]|tara:strand:+ start:122 stop:595 length:474 start_codon:yes stop_codon:yes gene_type:complete